MLQSGAHAAARASYAARADSDWPTMHWWKGSSGLGWFALAAFIAFASSLRAQDNSPYRNTNSSSLAATIARSHAKLADVSIPADQTAGPAVQVFDKLLHEIPTGKPAKVDWQLRILDSQTGNAFSLPDGGIYVDREIVRLLAGSPGLWAALLSHEIIHVTKQHWVKLAAARISLLQARDDWKIFALGALPVSTLPAPLELSVSDLDAKEELAAFSRDLEMEADASGVELMARAGFHPDFVIALYHLMKAQDSDSTALKSFFATHPGWDTRESRLQKKLSTAIAEFDRRWPDPATSPGGPAPIIAFTKRPEVKFSADRKIAEVGLPLRCENSTGSAKVVLVMHDLQHSSATTQHPSELEQALPCTAEQTAARFEVRASGPDDGLEAEFYVMDDRGWVLARSQRFRIEY